MSIARMDTSRLRSSQHGRNGQKPSNPEQIGRGRVPDMCEMLRGPYHDAANTLSRSAAEVPKGKQTHHCRTRMWWKELRSSGSANPQVLANVWEKSVAEMDERFCLTKILTIFQFLLFLRRKAPPLETLQLPR